MKQNKLRYGGIFDILASIGLLLLTAFTTYQLFHFGMIPWLYALAGSIVLFLLWFIFTVLIFKKSNGFLVNVRRVLTLLLCALLAFVSFRLDKLTSTVNKVVSNDQITQTVHIVALTNSGFTSVDDLSNGTIGIQSDSDQESADFGLEELNKKIGSTYQVYEDISYQNLLTDMVNGQTDVDAFIISDAHYKTLETFNADYLAYTTILDTYTRTIDAPQSTKDISKEPFVVLISGIDEVGSADQKLRSDVNILVFINPITKKADLVSLPRDGMIPNLAIGGLNDKLTHTGNNGIHNTVASIENFFQIDIDFYLRVSFDSLIQIVDTLGGIDVDVAVTFDEQDENRSFAPEDMIHLDAGMQTLNGREALAYARHRDSYLGSNLGREAAQQQIITAIVKKTFSVSGLSNFDKLMDIVPIYVVTNMPSNQITNFISSQITSIGDWQISSMGSMSQGHNTQEFGFDAYLFSKSEVNSILQYYDAMMNPKKLSDFSFDLDQIYREDSLINKDPNLYWSEDFQ